MRRRAGAWRRKQAKPCGTCLLISALPVPLHRARETAALILGERAGQIPVIPDERIREINFGVLEGKVFKDQEGNILNEDLKTFFKDPWNYKRPEGGENIEDIVRRTGEFWKEKISDPDLQDKTSSSHPTAARYEPCFRMCTETRKISGTEARRQTAAST